MEIEVSVDSCTRSSFETIGMADSRAPRTGAAFRIAALEPLERIWRLGARTCVTARRDSLLPNAIDAVFREMAVEDAFGASRNLTLDLRRTDQATWRLFANGLPIFRVKDDSELAPMLEGTLAGYAVRTRDDCAVFHAASVEIQGRGLLLAGGKGIGKSTLSLMLSHRGARYFGDELAFVRFQDHDLEAFPKAATLKEGSFSLFERHSSNGLNGFNGNAPVVSYCDPVRGPVRYHHAPNPAKLGELSSIALIVFPRYTPGASQLQLTELEPHEVALDLIRQCFGGLERDPRTLELVASLSKIRAYGMEYPDASSACSVLGELI
jgi:hypothetical protein